MKLATYRHSQLCIWLGSLLSIVLLAMPVTFALGLDEVRSEEGDPTESCENEIDEVTATESHAMQRRLRRERLSARQSLRATHRASADQTHLASRRLSAGQISLWGRCGPLRC